MKRKINKLVLIFLIIGGTIKGFSQNFLMERDTFYFITIIGSLPNGSPIATEALLSDINALKKFNKNSVNEFFCDFYHLAISTEDPTMGYDKMIRYFPDSANIWYSDIYSGLSKMNRCSKSIKRLTFKDNQSLTIYVSKIVAFFWKLPFSEKSIISHSIPIKCYDGSFYLILKNVIEVLKIKKSEINSIEKSWK